ncbi:response regulator transcription factor [Desulfomicrobium escambiense]|uniref:response regulator transcription factor n=1 Tax=Desulfomicrobium escambiense TaxID=29503 RepID=UPI0004285DB7|nr:response regulator transcription factor [Desulfomicrobium escambiense]
MSTLKRILIVDDHPLYRDGLRARLCARPDFSVVGEAGTSAEGLRMTKELTPDLAVVDISLPDGSGIELTREMRAVRPDMPVLIVSMHAKLDFIAAAFQAGASGYMSKESGGEGILQAIDTVLAGGQYLDGSLSPTVLRRLNDISGRKAKTVDASYGTLSLREQQVMRLLAEGLTPEEIAAKLFVSRKTVLNHRYSIMTKLGIKSPMAFVRHAARLGLIDIDE